MPEFSGVEPFTSWDGAFTDKELDAIVAYGDALRPAEATVMDSADDNQKSGIRITRISWIKQSQETLWMYQKLLGATSSINQLAYCFDLSMLETLQYTVYLAGEGGHYDWHVDHGHTPRRRKLSLVLQLSAPTDYEGCELQIHAASQIDTAPKTRGSLIAFPSYVLHRVTPITAGIRKSLVMWCSGPRFR
jgi:PKHD-type hydroxylase